MSHVSLDARAACIPVSQLLFDWREDEHKARFPVTFAVERETARVWSLRLVPAGLPQLAASLVVPSADRLLLLSGGGPLAVYARRVRRGVPVVPATLLPRLRAPVELIHVARGCAASIRPADIPTCLLSDPEAALPPEWGSRFALSIQDGCHGVIYTGEPAVVRTCLRDFLCAYQRSVLGGSVLGGSVPGGDVALPPIEDQMLDPWLEPQASDTYVEVSFCLGARFWTMDLRLLEAGSEVPIEVPTRWVCEGEGGSWRAGWSW